MDWVAASMQLMYEEDDEMKRHDRSFLFADYRDQALFQEPLPIRDLSPDHWHKKQQMMRKVCTILYHQNMIRLRQCPWLQ